MPLSSYRVLSTHYRGSPAHSSSPKVDPDKIVSMRGLSPSLTSYGYGHAKFHVIGDDVVTVTASGNHFKTLKENFARFGPVTQIDDYGMDRWKAAGENVRPNMFSLIPVIPNIAYITGAAPLGMYLPSNRDTPINLQTTPRLVEAVAPNEMGIHVSKHANLKY